MQIYRNKLALPEAYVGYSAVRSSCAAESLKLIREKSFVAARDIVAELPDSTALSRQDGTAISPADAIERPSTEKVVIQIHSVQKGIAVLTDAFYPGWTATLDAKDVAVFPVNGMFRGVMVESGKHELVYEYHCDAYENGRRIFLSGILIMMLYIALTRFRKSTPPKA